MYDATASVQLHKNSLAFGDLPSLHKTPRGTPARLSQDRIAAPLVVEPHLCRSCPHLYCRVLETRRCANRKSLFSSPLFSCCCNVSGHEVHELLVKLHDFDGNQTFAHYSDFSIGPEVEGYALKVLGGYRGTAGDSLYYHAGSKFSTKDVDQDAWQEGSCAKAHGRSPTPNCSKLFYECVRDRWRLVVQELRPQ